MTEILHPADQKSSGVCCFLGAEGATIVKKRCQKNVRHLGRTAQRTEELFTWDSCKKFTKQEISWMMYDWANSAHSVIVVTILPIIF